MVSFQRIKVPENLHERVTRALAQKVLEAERDSRELVFPNEAELCQQLGVSRTILREAVKVLADKGMVEVRQRLGTRAKSRASWNQLDPDILSWWAELGADTRFLRELGEVRLAIEPTAAGFAAVRATSEEIAAIGRCLEEREARLRASNLAEAVDLGLEFHSAIMAGCHNPLLEQLSRAIRRPLRIALSYTAGFRTADLIDVAAHRRLFDAICSHDSMKARKASEKIVGLAMLSIEEVIRLEEKAKSSTKTTGKNGDRTAAASSSVKYRYS